MVERSDWAGAAGLRPQESRFAYVDAITRFARALGAARSGNPAAARADIAKLAELRDALRAGERPVLDGAGGHPMAGCQRLGAAGRGQAGRGARAR